MALLLASSRTYPTSCTHAFRPLTTSMCLTIHDESCFGYGKSAPSIPILVHRSLVCNLHSLLVRVAAKHRILIVVPPDLLALSQSVVPSGGIAHTWYQLCFPW